MSHPMRCLRCDRELADSGPSGMPPFKTPLDGTFWRTRGNYGSEIIDNDPHQPALEIYICDPCLRERAAVVYTVTPGPLSQDDAYEPGIAFGFVLSVERGHTKGGEGGGQ